jgi:uncharacterized SAM-binding protein YcdF (DUF218 family)
MFRTMPPTLHSPSSPAEASVALPVRNLLWRRRLAWLLSLGGVFLALFVFRAAILTGVAEVWVVNNPVTKADAIVILGGGLENRPFAAAKLFHEGVAPQILYMNVKLSPTEEMGITLPEKEQTRRILLSNNVPETAMTLIGSNVASTYDESRAVRAWIAKSGAKSIIIPTDLFHTRRVRWIFQRELRDEKVNIQVLAVPLPTYGLTNWWRDEDGVVAFETEVIKFVYYRLKY